jgi:hypothetical protein
MWECQKCHERHEDSFEVCWKCGTSKAGVEDPAFRTADEQYLASDADRPEAAREQATAGGTAGERVGSGPGAVTATPPGAANPGERSAGGKGTAGSGPQYEFTAEQNATIGDLARKMRFVAVFLILGGALECLTVLGGHLTGLISGLVHVFLGAWTWSAGNSFRQIVDTQGQDITHLMSALGDLRRVYGLLYVLLIIALVLLAVVVPLALLATLSR